MNSKSTGLCFLPCVVLCISTFLQRACIKFNTKKIHFTLKILVGRIGLRVCGVTNEDCNGFLEEL